MGIRFMISVILGIILVYQASSMELLTNYKLWDSAGGSKSYDYSGNHCHAILDADFLTTDRGIATNNGPTYLTFTNNASRGSLYYQEITLSFWLLNQALISNLYYGLEISSIFHDIHYRFDSSMTLIDSYSGNNYTFAIEGWNLHTIIYKKNLNPNSTIYLYIYLNLSPIPIYSKEYAYTESLKYAIWYIGIENYMILYEVWVHTGLSSITDLSSLLSPLSECGCNYNCPKSPKITCLRNYDGSKNFNGEICPSKCISSNLSCDTKSDCIWKSKSSCILEFYHLESKECLFYCPEDSCIYNFEIRNDGSSSFSFSCKEGYKKASDNPPACVPEIWMFYHQVGYSYTYDTIEEGYTPDPLGNCCICDEDYIAVSTDPLLCIKLTNCLAYEQVGSSYICSECAEGYMTDSDGKCNLCDEEYQMIIESPVTCALSVENCAKYLYEDTQWICEECNQGYKISNQRQCDQCQAGYLNIGSESLICESETSKCIEYEISSGESMCSLCEEGYSLDSSFKCTECEVGYIRLPQDYSICTRGITNCQDYGLYFNDWICIMCKDGYQFDNQMTCNQCAEGYQSASSYPIECTKSTTESAETEQYLSTEEEVISAESIKSVNTAVTTIVLVSVSVSDAISMNPSTLVFYLNTIKIISFATYLNVDMPFEIREQQSSSRKYMQNINIMSYIAIDDKEPDQYSEYVLDDPYGFLPEVIYQLLILLFIMTLNLVFYLLKRCGTVKLKAFGTKILKMFKFSVYIQFFMITYIDVTYGSFRKLVNPKEDTIWNIFDYNLAVIFTTICVVSPVFLASFLNGNKENLNEEDFISFYGFLVKDFKDSIKCVYFHVLFLVRRLGIAATVILFNEFPKVQVALCSLLCWLIFLHQIITRPFRDRVINILFILIELSISIFYTVPVVFLYSKAYNEGFMLVMLGCIYMSSLLHSILGYYKIIRVICSIIRTYLRRRRSQFEELKTRR